MRAPRTRQQRTCDGVEKPASRRVSRTDADEAPPRSCTEENVVCAMVRNQSVRSIAKVRSTECCDAGSESIKPLVYATRCSRRRRTSRPPQMATCHSVLEGGCSAHIVRTFASTGVASRRFVGAGGGVGVYVLYAKCYSVLKSTHTHVRLVRRVRGYVQGVGGSFDGNDGAGGGGVWVRRCCSQLSAHDLWLADLRQTAQVGRRVVD